MTGKIKFKSKILKFWESKKNSLLFLVGSRFIFNKTIEQIAIAAIGLGRPMKKLCLLSLVWSTLNRANLIDPIKRGNEDIIAKYKNKYSDTWLSKE